MQLNDGGNVDVSILLATESRSEGWSSLGVNAEVHVGLYRGCNTGHVTRGRCSSQRGAGDVCNDGLVQAAPAYLRVQQAIKSDDHRQASLALK
eukprot:908544-Amphidinium_carterae.1